jgi:hypothetical protein
LSDSTKYLLAGAVIGALSGASLWFTLHVSRGYGFLVGVFLVVGVLGAVMWINE